MSRRGSPQGMSKGGRIDMARVAIAAFDLDGTLLRGQSGTLILKYLARKGLVTPRTFVRCTWWGIRYKLHLPFRQNEVRETIFRDLGKFSEEEVGQIMEDFHNEIMTPRYKPAGLAELKRHIEAGERTVLISATFDQVAQVAREHLGCEVALATLMERDENGRFTGRVAGETTEGPEKVARLRAWADGMFGKDGWELVHFFGDHHSDLPMLELATNPHVVDPGPTLRRHAKERDWPIVEWR